MLLVPVQQHSEPIVHGVLWKFFIARVVCGVGATLIVASIVARSVLDNLIVAFTAAVCRVRVLGAFARLARGGRLVGLGVLGRVEGVASAASIVGVPAVVVLVASVGGVSAVVGRLEVAATSGVPVSGPIPIVVPVVSHR